MTGVLWGVILLLVLVLAAMEYAVNRTLKGVGAAPSTAVRLLRLANLILLVGALVLAAYVMTRS